MDDLGPPPSAGKTVVIGCGNLLRGDDAVGPILVRHLWDRGVGDHVLLVDGGTAGMDVAFKMDSARRVILVDASSTGAPPGTVYRVPGHEIEDVPPLTGLHTHQFRWDHALAFARWLLKDRYPTDITVFLVEAGSCEPGADLTPPVEASMRRVLDLVSIECDAGAALMVELTADGYLRLDRELAARFFPADALVALQRGRELWLLPLTSQEGGGLLLKQRTASGDRSALVHEVLPTVWPTGRLAAVWDAAAGALRVDLGGGGASGVSPTATQGAA